MSKLSSSKSLNPNWTKVLPDYVTTMATSASGEILIAGCGDGTVCAISTKTGDLLWSQSAHRQGTNVIALSEASGPENGIVASGGQDGFLRIWNLKTGTPIAAIKQKGFSVDHVEFSPDGKYLAASTAKHLELFEPMGRHLKSFAPRKATIAGLCWTPKTQKIVTTCYGSVDLWKLDSDDPEEVFPWKGSTICLKLSPSAGWVVCGTQDNGIHVWNTRTKEDLEMSGYPIKVKELSWSADSRFLATGGGSQVTIWDFSGEGPAGTTPAVLDAHREPVTSLQFHQVKSALISGDKSGSCYLWDTVRSKVLAQTKIPSPVTVVKWGSKQDSFFVAGENGTVSSFGPLE